MEPILRGLARPPKKIALTDIECKALCQSVGLTYMPGYENRVLEYTITDETPDRYGDIVRAAGVELEDFVKNPVVHLSHDTHHFPIGNSVKTWVDTQNNSVKSWCLFCDDRVDKTGLSDTAYRFASNGFMKGASVGFLPVEKYVPKTDKERMEMGLGVNGTEFKKSKLLEYSVCTVPCNPNALTQLSKTMEIKQVIEHLEKDVPENAIGKPGYEDTENEIRYRVKEPDLFEADSFRRITLQKDKPRVYAIIGKLKGETSTTVQALRFPKEDDWTIEKAKKWVTEHFKKECPDTDIVKKEIVSMIYKDLDINNIDKDMHDKLDTIINAIAEHKSQSGDLHKQHNDASASLHAQSRDLVTNIYAVVDILKTKIDELEKKIKPNEDDNTDTDCKSGSEYYADLLSGISSLRKNLKTNKEKK